MPFGTKGLMILNHKGEQVYISVGTRSQDDFPCD